MNAAASRRRTMIRARKDSEIQKLYNRVIGLTTETYERLSGVGEELATLAHKLKGLDEAERKRLLILVNHIEHAEKAVLDIGIGVIT